MVRPDEILNKVRVASPCPASWENMRGDDRTRFCGLCKLNVYNLSGMDKEEAARLVSESKGRLCIRYYQRRDGTMLTRDCPVGLALIRKRLAWALSCVFVLFFSPWGYAGTMARGPLEESSLSPLLADLRERARQIEPLKTVLNWIDPPKPGAVAGRMAMGVMPSPVVGSPAVPVVQGEVTSR